MTRPTPVNGTTQIDPGTSTTPAANVCYTPNGPFANQAITNLLGVQINPSNTGNIRGQSRFTLADGLILTVDPTYQYVLANGGSQGALLKETDSLLTQGVVGSQGVDLNGDGDFKDTVLVGRPSITNTNRVTVLSSLVWKPDNTNTFRIAYTYDRAHHRQTGEYSFTDDQFNLTNPFFGRNGTPIITRGGHQVAEPRPHLDRASEPAVRAVYRQVLRQPAAGRARPSFAVVRPRSRPALLHAGHGVGLPGLHRASDDGGLLDSATPAPRFSTSSSRTTSIRRRPSQHALRAVQGEV